MGRRIGTIGMYYDASDILCECWKKCEMLLWKLLIARPFYSLTKLLISIQPCMTDISVCDKATAESALLSLSFTHRAPSAATQMVTFNFPAVKAWYIY